MSKTIERHLAWMRQQLAELPPVPSVPADGRFVYFIQAVTGGPIKIGVATNPLKRLSELQPGNPQKLQVIGVIPEAGQRGEAVLHKEFRYLRMSGEWFRVDDVLLARIKQVAVPYGAVDPAREWVAFAPGGIEVGTVLERDVLTLAQLDEVFCLDQRWLQQDFVSHRYGHSRYGERFGMTRQQVGDLIEAQAVRTT